MNGNNTLPGKVSFFFIKLHALSCTTFYLRLRLCNEKVKLKKVVYDIFYVIEVIQAINIILYGLIALFDKRRIQNKKIKSTKDLSIKLNITVIIDISPY